MHFYIKWYCAAEGLRAAREMALPKAVIGGYDPPAGGPSKARKSPLNFTVIVYCLMLRVRPSAAQYHTI